MQESFRAQAPLGLRALGMSSKNVETIKESGFDQDVARGIIELRKACLRTA